MISFISPLFSASSRICKPVVNFPMTKPLLYFYLGGVVAVFYTNAGSMKKVRADLVKAKCVPDNVYATLITVFGFFGLSLIWPFVLPLILSLSYLRNTILAPKIVGDVQKDQDSDTSENGEEASQVEDKYAPEMTEEEIENEKRVAVWLEGTENVPVFIAVEPEGEENKAPVEPKDEEDWSAWKLLETADRGKKDQISEKEKEEGEKLAEKSVVHYEDENDGNDAEEESDRIRR